MTTFISIRRDEKEISRATRKRLKEERMRRRERKHRRKMRPENVCAAEGLNCFTHDDDHWRTAPFWTDGPFCFCINANNNTYSCVRTINETHNILYCEFVTGLTTFYNLRKGKSYEYHLSYLFFVRFFFFNFVI